MAAMQLTDRHHELLRWVRESPSPPSRRDLHLKMQLRPNTIGELVEDLIQLGLIREGKTEPVGRGRPQVPLCIDTERCCIAGLAVESDAIHMTWVNLDGERLASGDAWARDHQAGLQRDLLSAIDKLGQFSKQTCRTVAVGISFRGLIDVDAGRITSAASSADAESVDLEALTRAVAAFDSILVVDNDMHAIAAQWMLMNHLSAGEDTLLIYLEDGQVGSALLIDGRPNRGCILGGNELGHMRFNVETPKCYCGHHGCLERIFSTPYLKRQQAGPTLIHAANSGASDALGDIMPHLATGIANCINFVRPHRVHLISPFASCTAFCERLDQEIKKRSFALLADRVNLNWSSPPQDGFALAAAWLGMTAVYLGNWSHGYAVQQV